jgi:hypothetical protein
MNFIKHKTKKRFDYNVKIFTLSVAIIMIWRWVWNFLDHYFFPDQFNLSNLLTIIIWLLIFFLNDYDLDDL